MKYHKDKDDLAKELERDRGNFDRAMGAILDAIANPGDRTDSLTVACLNLLGIVNRGFDARRELLRIKTDKPPHQYHSTLWFAAECFNEYGPEVVTGDDGKLQVASVFYDDEAYADTTEYLSVAAIYEQMTSYAREMDRELPAPESSTLKYLRNPNAKLAIKILMPQAATQEANDRLLECFIDSDLEEALEWYAQANLPWQEYADSLNNEDRLRWCLLLLDNDIPVELDQLKHALLFAHQYPAPDSDDWQTIERILEHHRPGLKDSKGKWLRTGKVTLYRGGPPGPS